MSFLSLYGDERIADEVERINNRPDDDFVRTSAPLPRNLHRGVDRGYAGSG